MSNIGPREEVKGIKDLTLDELKDRFELYREKLKVARQNFEFGSVDDLSKELRQIKREYQKRLQMNIV